MKIKWRTVWRIGTVSALVLWLFAVSFVIVTTEIENSTDWYFYWPRGTPDWVARAYNSLQDVYETITDLPTTGIVTMRLYQMPAEPGRNVLVLDPQHPRWQGRSQEVEQILQKLIATAREEKLLKEDILPIRVGVARLRSVGGLALGKSAIIVATGELSYRRSPSPGWIKYILAHEFAHNLSWERIKENHGATWQRICDTLTRSVLDRGDGRCLSGAH